MPIYGIQVVQSINCSVIRWESSFIKKLPQELQELLNQQRAEYEEMINEKNRLIKEFESELKIKDDLYVKDLKQQSADVDLLLERMEDQTGTLMRAYKKEVREIENAYVRERKKLVCLYVVTDNYSKLSLIRTGIRRNIG